MTISEIIQKYKNQLDYLDLEILIANSLGKTREFVLTYPEFKIPSLKIENLKLKIARRVKGEPIAYILGHKEFYGLDFIVNNHTLVPRPETEMMVEMAIADLQLTTYNLQQDTTFIDVGTGSGNIIISIANELEKTKNSRVIPDLIRNPERSTNLDSSLHGDDRVKYFGIDISKEALMIAKKNAKINGVNKKIKFFYGCLLEPFIGNCPPASICEAFRAGKLEIGNSTIVIVANLPYLSKEIYNSALIDVKKFEPKSALYSAEAGLSHYKKLLKQIKKIYAPYSMLRIICFFVISPEQKPALTKLIKSILPSAKIEFQKDLAKKWRACRIEL